MKTWVRSVAAYTLAVVLCLGFLVIVLQLWKADLRVPFLYWEDALLVDSWVKGVLDNGWYLHNAYLGAPAAQDFHDFPMAENLHFLLIKLLGLVCSTHGMVLNLYFLLTFPLVTVTALAVFRHFGVSYLPALAGSLLYAFLPYHLFRNEGHLFLAAYYLVPLAVMVALWIMRGEGPFFVENAAAKPQAGWRRALVAIVIGLLVSSAGIYYAAFTCFFLLVAGLGATFQRQKLFPLGSALLLIGVIAVGGIANISPSLVYRWQHGYNRVAVERGKAQAEIYGLKTTQLLLPATSHRIAKLARFKELYNQRAPLVNENDSASLGLIGSCGFLALVGLILARRPETGPVPVAQSLALFNLLGVLLAGMGGFGALFCLILPWIRGYNRISVFIGFFALFAVVLFLDWVARRFAQTRRTQMLFAGGLAVFTVLGILDQTPTKVVPDYKTWRNYYDGDEVFVSTVEASLPENARVFQLPYVPFPEAARASIRIGEYDHLRPYLHSHKLHWSFGGMKGREADRWYRETAQQPLPKLVWSLASAGFSGLWVDQFGYADRGAECVAELTRLVGTPPLIDFNGRVAFFSLIGSDRADSWRRAQPDSPGWIAARMRPRDPEKVCKRFDYKIHTFSSQWQGVTMNAAPDGWRLDVTYLQGGTPYHVTVLQSRPDSFRVTVQDESKTGDSSGALCNIDDRDIEYRGHNEYEKLFLTCLSKVAVNSLQYAVGR
jgi:hypothetical protein